MRDQPLMSAEMGSGRNNAITSRQPAPRGTIVVLLLFMLLEYLRIHHFVPILDVLKVQTVIFGALTLIVVAETSKGAVHLARQSWLLLGFVGLTVLTILPATIQAAAYSFALDFAKILIGYFAISYMLRNERDLMRCECQDLI